MFTAHADFQHFGSPPSGPLLHLATPTDFLSGAKHGTSAFGIIFGNGATNGQARGMLPEAEQGIFSGGLFQLLPISTDVQEQVNPSGPYRSVFHSESFAGVGPSYTSTSFTYDDVVYRHDMLMTILMHNYGLTGDGNDLVSTSAWAKNVVSVGGIRHFNTLSRADDRWCTCPTTCSHCASIGPAQDGRVKPDLVHFYDQIFTTTSLCDEADCNDVTCDPYDNVFFPDCDLGPFTSGHGSFGGTSGATPIVAGCFGLFFQMWHQEVFPGFGGGTSVFDDRAHAATAKAMMVNTSFQYDLPSSSDITRFTQGWGMPDLKRMHEYRDKMFIVDESDHFTALDAGNAKTYYVTVSSGQPALKATMVYTDPPGTTNATLHRINDLSLRLTAPPPNGTTYYWGNHGLQTSNWSLPGGTPDKINTVENVFVSGPTAGVWRVDVIAFELNVDGRPETTWYDWDFALVISGVAGSASHRGDWDGDGVTTSADLYGFVDAFLKGEADVDGDGVSTAKDLFDFLVQLTEWR